MDTQLQQLLQRIQDLELIEAEYQQLRQREDLGREFREKLKILNEINAELGVVASFHELCRQAVILGLSRLGFERLSLWFLDAEGNRMVGSYGTDEEGNLRDERSSNWTFENTPLVNFLRGHTTPIVRQDDAPIYNNRSEIIGRGWHVSVPLLYQGQFIGYMTADNHVTQQPLKPYQPELLGLYGATIGHLAAHQRDQEIAKKLADAIRLKQERVGILETFITHVGHDFRTPLTIIGTNTYLLTKAQDEARKAEITQSIHDQIMYINHVINQMLEVVKLENELVLNRSTLKLSTLIYQAAQVIESLVDEKHILCEINAESPLLIEADAEWLGRALSEIMENAAQYTPEGGRITIDLATHKTTLTIRVQDTGIGIAEEHLERIFNHLYRVDEARTQQGVGLGLTLAKKVIEAHGGQIHVESTPKKGSTFTITLPL